MSMETRSHVGKRVVVQRRLSTRSGVRLEAGAVLLVDDQTRSSVSLAWPDKPGHAVIVKVPLRLLATIEVRNGYETVISTCQPADGRKWDCQCARCGSSVEWEQCPNCEDGYSHHDCGDDCCCCADPEPNVRCHWCGGMGGWLACIAPPRSCQANPRPGREKVDCGAIEWFCLSGQGSGEL